ncbi:MAG: hypothetical protein KKD48_05360 [Nanoarchaeota archaeon]|nr:hypothetical protein [Nanoarchaeota archaeon]
MKNYIKNILGSIFLAIALSTNQQKYNNKSSIEQINKEHLKNIMSESGFKTANPVYKKDGIFDEFSDYLNNIYIPAYNECALKLKNPKINLDDKCINNDKLPGLLELELKTGEFCLCNNAEDNTKYFEEHGKVYAVLESGKNNLLKDFIMGDIIFKGSGVYKDYNQNFSYNFILFEPTAESYSNLMLSSYIAFWDAETKTAYLDLKQTLKQADNLRSTSESVLNCILYRPARLYNSLIDDSRRNNTSYEEEFLRMKIETVIKKHEVVHNLFIKLEANNIKNNRQIEDIVNKMEEENCPEKYKDMYDITLQ